MEIEKGFKRLDSWINSAINSMSPQRRKILFKKLAKSVRQNQQQNISKQQNPDGISWEERRSQNIKKNNQINVKKKMMLGLRLARRMKITSSSSGFEVGYSGRNAKIAAVHQFGGMDIPSPYATKMKYPVRELLGFSDQQIDQIRDIVINHITDEN